MFLQYNLAARLSDIRRHVLFKACLAEFPQIESSCNRIPAKRIIQFEGVLSNEKSYSGSNWNRRVLNKMSAWTC